MDESKKIILCADDFGLNQGVSLGILKLVAKQRLSAVSCMVNQPDFEAHAASLNDLKSNIQIGLHFNVTEGHLLSSQQTGFTLNSLLIKTHLGLIHSSIIEQEFIAQLDRFVDKMGCMPDFIDGHQHVHQFPGLREILIKQYSQAMREQGTYIRCTYPALSLPKYQMKSQILAWAGGKKLLRQLEQQGIAHNPFFSGIYDFAPEADYRALFRQWLALAENNTLMMCHPGEGHGPGDVIAASRLKEMEYLQSEHFVRDLQDFQCTLSILNCY